MTQPTSDIELVRAAWEAFSRGDVTAATAALASDVRWYGSDRESPEDGCRSRADALAFLRQAIAAECLPKS